MIFRIIAQRPQTSSPKLLPHKAVDAFLLEHKLNLNEFLVHFRPSFADAWCTVRRIASMFTSWPVIPTSSRTYASQWPPPVTPAWPSPPPPAPPTAAPRIESPAHPC